MLSPRDETYEKELMKYVTTIEIFNYLFNSVSLLSRIEMFSEAGL